MQPRHRLFLADGRSEVNGLGASINLLVRWGAVATGVVGCAVERFAARSWTEGVSARGKGVTPFTMEDVR